MRWCSVDPGESTGLAVWEDDKLEDALTLGLWEMIDSLTRAAGVTGALAADPQFRHVYHPEDQFDELFAGWERLVVEDWSLYPWELENLAWDKCRTARGIGALEALCRLTGREIVLQGANIKDAAEAGGAESLFLSPRHENRHANDAIMHGVYFIARQRPGPVTTVSPPTEGAPAA